MPKVDNVTSYFLTYPRIPNNFDNDSRARLHVHLRDVGTAYGSELAYVLIAVEQHRDGAAPSVDADDRRRHWHCVAYYRSKLRLGQRVFDFEGQHPNIRSVGRRKADWDNVIAYCRKEDQEPYEWGEPRHAEKSCAWSDALAAPTRAEAEDILLREKPRDWIVNRRNIDYALDQMWPVQETQEIRLPRGPSDFSLPGSIEEWKLENFEYV